MLFLCLNLTSLLQINIDQVTRRQITVAMTCGDDMVPINVFDRAQGKVFSIMENDAHPRFVNSNYYKEAMASKRYTIESVFANIIPQSLSPTKPFAKPSKNSNNNNLKDLSPEGKADIFRHFNFGFRKPNSSKPGKAEESIIAEDAIIAQLMNPCCAFELKVA